MRDSTGFRNNPRLFFGGLLVALGILLTLDRLGFLDWDNLVPYFLPAVLLVAGVVRLLPPASPSGRFFGGLLIVFNLVFGYLLQKGGDLDGESVIQPQHLDGAVLALDVEDRQDSRDTVDVRRAVDQDQCIGRDIGGQQAVGRNQRLNDR